MSWSRLLISLILWTYCASSAVYVEVFRDNFSGTSLNLTKWTPTRQKSLVNSELQYYIPDDVMVRNGHLALRTRRNHYQGRNYTSGRVDSKGKFDFVYGEVEWRAKLPTGKGVWPALWLLYHDCPAAVPCTTWPPELDVMEFRGDITNRVSHALHYGRFPHNFFYVSETLLNQTDFTKDFHVYKARWEPGEVTWYIDGRETFHVKSHKNVPSERMHVIMNVAVGGNYANYTVPDESTPFPTEMLIDYVVVRQKR